MKSFFVKFNCNSKDAKNYWTKILNHVFNAFLPFAIVKPSSVHKANLCVRICVRKSESQHFPAYHFLYVKLIMDLGHNRLYWCFYQNAIIVLVVFFVTKRISWMVSIIRMYDTKMTHEYVGCIVAIFSYSLQLSFIP